MLKRQEVHHSVYLVSQRDVQSPKLINVGYVEALREAPFDCFVFSNVDVLHLDNGNLDRCGQKNPRHLSVAVDKFDCRCELLTGNNSSSAPFSSFDA
ncbi:unnamed protein product [Lampetra planeri]